MLNPSAVYLFVCLLVFLEGEGGAESKVRIMCVSMCVSRETW